MSSTGYRHESQIGKEKGHILQWLQGQLGDEVLTGGRI